MREFLSVLVLTAVALSPALALAGGAGSACAIGGKAATIAEQEIETPKDAKTARSDRGQEAAKMKTPQVAASKKTK